MVKICIELCNGKKMYADLYEDVAPKTVANILSLVDRGFYRGIVFHRIIQGFMCQCGAYSVANNSIFMPTNIALNVAGEFSANGFKNDLHHAVGVLSLARTDDYNSGSSQFFICSADCAYLDGNYAAFGRLSDLYSLDNLLELEKIQTTTVGEGFENFPSGNRLDYTIRNIYRV